MVEVFRGADSVRFDRMVGGRNRFHTVPYARVRRRRKQVLDLRRRTATRFAFPPRNTPFPRGGADASDATPPFATRQPASPPFIFPPSPPFSFFFLFSPFSLPTLLTLVLQLYLECSAVRFYNITYSVSFPSLLERKVIRRCAT